MEFVSNHFGCQTCRTESDEFDQGAGKAANTGKPDTVMEPQSILIELRCCAKGVPCPIVGKAAEVSNFDKEPSDRRD